MVSFSALTHKGHQQSSNHNDNSNHSSGDHSHQPQLPPPPYALDAELGDGQPILLAETTTTTKVVTTTTQTTTHFFSLPLWRRRAAPAAASTSARQSIVGVDELGSMTAALPQRSISLQVNKDLPPTPASSDDSGHMRTGHLVGNSIQPSASAFPPGATAQHTDMDSPRTSRVGTPDMLSMPGSPPPRGPAAQPAFVLARAALGLGLPHATPQQAAISASAMEVNTVAFVTPAPPEPRPSTSRPSTSSGFLRRAKSFTKPSRESVDEVSHSTDAHADMPRRMRGLSLGFHLNSTADVQATPDPKGKRKANDGGEVTPPTISRKSSFFSRKRRDSAKQRTPPVPASSLIRAASSQLALPPVQPLTPFNIEDGPPSPTTQWMPPANLRRAHSDRKHDRTPSGSHNGFAISGSPSPKMTPPAAAMMGTPSTSQAAMLGPASAQRPRRPQTADSTTPRSRAHSLFMPPPSIAMPLSLYMPVDAPLKSVPSPKAPSPTTSRMRPRSHTNPHRFSLNLSSSTSPANSAGNTTSFVSGAPFSASPSSSPRPSTNRPPPREVLKPQTEESPEVYLERLTEAVSKAELASVLASSADLFHASALRTYIGRFQFFNDPLDVALRKLLVDVGLPRETQQIDRVIEAFSARYAECNPNLFVADDQAYILAFSLIMLHTDAFNKSNKRKMTKADYVKNTRLPGVPPEVLDYFYDNIVFAPFIFIDDPLDVNGQRGFFPEPPSRSLSSMGMPGSSGVATPGGSSLLRGPKLDPYYLITQNLLDPLRVPTHNYVPWESPYSYRGTGAEWNEDELRRAFATATTIKFNNADDRRYSTAPFFAMPVGGISTPLVAGSANVSGSMSPVGAMPEFPSALPAVATRESRNITVTKSGILVRKDEAGEGGKRAQNRKWREWSVVLTGSQLLFFRDATWVAEFLSDDQRREPPASLLRPDELLSVRGAVAVYDREYLKYRHTMRFIMADGRHLLLQAPNEREMNEWIARINYASAFKTAGVRMRPLGMSGQDIELTGVAAAASHLKEIASPKRNHVSGRPVIRRWDGRSSAEILADPSPNAIPSTPSHEEGPMPSSPPPGTVDVEIPVPSLIESGAQFKATFDQVKADLAAGRRVGSIEHKHRGHRPHQRSRSFSSSSLAGPSSPTSPTASLVSGFPSRSAVVRGKIRELGDKLTAAQTQLDADMRFVRNIAILTPFQRTTRERLEASVQGIAKRITSIRFEIARLTCHREVLASDLRAAEQDWWRTKDIALRAATRALDSVQADNGTQQRQSSRLTVPRPSLTIPAPFPPRRLDDKGDGVNSSGSSSAGSAGGDVIRSPPRPIPGDSAATAAAPLERRSSSQTGSFYSAADFTADCSAPASDTEMSFGKVASSLRGKQSLVFSEPDSLSLTPVTDNNGAGSFSSSGFPFPRTSMGSSRRESPIRTTNVNGHERYYTAQEGEELAEEWNKTQAGKRVSLVKLPSDLRLPSFSFRRSSDHSPRR